MMGIAIYLAGVLVLSSFQSLTWLVKEVPAQTTIVIGPTLLLLLGAWTLCYLPGLHPSHRGAAALLVTTVIVLAAAHIGTKLLYDKYHTRKHKARPAHISR